MTFDGKAFGADIVAIVRGHVERSLAPLNARLDAFEKMIAAMPVPKDGTDGKSITLDDVAPMIKAETERVGASILDAAKASVAELVAAIPPAANGKDADVAAIVEEVTGAVVEGIKGLLPDPISKPQVADMISRALADQPAPAVVDEEAMKEFFKAHIGEQVTLTVAALPPVENGKDVDPDEVAALVTREAERILAGWDKPQDGKSVTVDELLPVIEDRVAKAVAVIPVPKDGKDGRDGVDVKDLLVVEGGELVATFTDGRTKALGQFRGKDGTDGANGKNGADGVGFDDMSLVIDEEGVMFKFVKGENVRQERIPVPFYRGVFKEGQTYHAGNCVSFGGSTWIAHAETADKPDGVSKTWQLSTKRGRDGKDGIMKPPIKPGPVKAG